MGSIPAFAFVAEHPFATAVAAFIILIVATAPIWFTALESALGLDDYDSRPQTDIGLDQ